jgi:hypothetical protein
MKTNETYYELLKISPHATVSEVVNAYHLARNTFSKESLAAYSLFSAQESETLLQQLELAYQTLSNLDLRREYDKQIGITKTEVLTPLSALPHPHPKPRLHSDLPSGEDTPFNGHWLRLQRERCGMSLEDVTRLTKIPLRYLEAMEEEAVAELPARVYCQGFVQNLAKLYRLNAKEVKSYLVHLDTLLKASRVR